MKKILIYLIKFYQKNISVQKPRRCRFFPTCSEYARQAIEEWGAFLGMFFVIYRLLRCNPLFRGGFDPVPKKRHKM